MGAEVMELSIWGSIHQRGALSAIHLVRGEFVREMIAQQHPGFVTELAGIRISAGMGQIVSSDQLRRSASEDGASDGMKVRIKAGADLRERCLTKVADGDALA